jgi:GNAT superfamily N-acetyltransferase
MTHFAGLPEGLSLRAATDADAAFMSDLYASTREDEMKLATAWSEAQKRAFLREQFALQDAHYRAHYPACERYVVERRGTPVGRMLVSVTAREVRLMDVALLPAWRGHGVGTALLRGVLAFADGAQLPVTLHVEPFNPALRMYQREGFAMVEMRGLYQFMRRPARAQLKTAS